MPAKKKKGTPVPIQTPVSAPIPDVPISAPIPEEAILAETPNEPPLERKNKVLFASGIAVAVAIAAGSLILLVLSVRTPKQSTGPTAVPTVQVQPTPTPQFVRGQIILDVLNGSGVAGAAGAAATKLAARGYTIGEIGNAAKQANTTVVVAAGLLSVKDALMADLAATIPTATYTGVLIEGTASAQIILGKQ